MTLIVSQPDETHGRAFTSIGHSLAGFVFLMFTLVYGVSFYQLEGWQHYFFSHALNLKDSCEVAALQSPTADFSRTLFQGATFKPIQVPHPLAPLFTSAELRDNNYIHIHYHCTVSIPPATKGEALAYLHVGWVFGQRAVIDINGSERASFRFASKHKPIVPFKLADLKEGRAIIDLWVVGKAGPRLGLVGVAPLAIATSDHINTRILGVETALSNVRYLYTLLPTLTLGLVLLMGWLYGIRSRLMLSALYYFAMTATFNLIVLEAELWPWDLDFSYALSQPVYTGSSLAFLLFATQILSLGDRYLIPAMTAILGLVIIQVAALFAAADPWPMYQYLANFYSLLCIPTALAIVIFGVKSLRAKTIDPARRRINLAFLALLTVYFLTLVADFICAQLLVPMRLSRQMDVFFPLFVGGVLFYTLALIENSLRSERAKRLKMETDLEVARGIQDSIAPPPSHTLLGNLTVSCHQRKHSQVAGDWMAVRQNGDDEVIAVVADATGKGMQAALVVHAVQSLWATELLNERLDVKQWMLRVNRTLVKLGERRPHSLTMGVVAISQQRLEYWCAAHIPLFVELQTGTTREMRAIIGRGNPLGLGVDLDLQSKVLEFAPDQAFSLLLGSDGIFTKGSRTSKRDVTAFLAALAKEGAHCLETTGADDDRTIVHIERQVASLPKKDRDTA